jgi:hypothetical protein
MASELRPSEDEKNCPPRVLHSKLHVWTVIAWLTGKFQVSYEHLTSILYSLLQVVDVADFCSINSSLPVFPEKKSEVFKSG